MNERRNQILTALKHSQEWMTGKEIARIFGVSDRTIRSDMGKINCYYGQDVIKANRRKGYQINNIENTPWQDKEKLAIPQSPKERAYYILYQILFQKTDLNIYHLQEELFVSECTIENDLKEIKNILIPYDQLTLNKKKNLIWLEGDEKEKRRLFKGLLRIETNGNFLNLDSIAEYYKDFDLIEIANLFNQIIGKYNYKIQGTTILLLMVHISIALERMLGRHHMVEEELAPEIQESKEYLIANEFYKEVSNILTLEITKSEVSMLAMLLMGKRSSAYRLGLENISDEVSALTINILKNLKEKFDIDFTGDHILIDGLQMHIQSLIKRTLVEQNPTNIYLKDIKWNYPMIFEMAVHVTDFIQEFIERTISEDEIGFITLHLGAAYERISQEKFKAVLIQPRNPSMENLCEEKILRNFHNRLEITAQFDYYDQRKVLKESPDLIISTLPLSHNLPIPSVHISLFVNYEDEAEIFSVLNQLEKSAFKNKYSSKIEGLFNEEFYYYNLDLCSRREVTDFMAHQLIEKNFASEDYLDSVHKREDMSSTSFAYSFALPHSLNVPCKTSVLSVAILKNPISWGEHQVKLVILLGFTKDDHKTMQVFLDWMNKILSDSKAFSQLIQSKNREEFIKNFI